MRSSNKTNMLALGAIGIVILALLLSIACAPKPAAEAEKKVKVGYMAFSTGPVGDCGLPATMIAADYFRWVNDQGGIDGVKIDYMWIDHGYEIPRSIAAYQRLKAWGAKIIWSFGTAPNDAIMKMAQEDRMPIMAWGGTGELFWPPNVFFATYLSYTEQGRYVPLWAMKNVPGLPKKPKLGMIMSDDAFGWAHARGPLFYQDVDGYEVVTHQFAPHGALDVTTQVRNVISAGADILMHKYTAGTAAVVVRDAIRLGFKGPIISGPQALDFALPKLSEGAAEAPNVYWMSYHRLLEDKLPEAEPIYKMMKTYHPGWDAYHPNTSKCFEHGIIAPFAITEGIKAALKMFGYENLTQANIIKGLESLKNLNVYGLQTLSFSPTDHRGNTKLAMYRFVKGDLKMVTDFEEAPAPADWEKQGKFKWAK